MDGPKQAAVSATRQRAAPGVEALVAALTITLGLQTIRTFIPLVVYVFGARPGATSIQLGALAIGVFLSAFLAGLPVRALGAARALGVAAAGLVAARLLAQAAGPGPALWICAAGVAAFLWAVPPLLALAHRLGPGAPARIAAGILVGLALDTAVAGAFGTWDPVWQRTPAAVAVTAGLALAYIASVRALGVASAAALPAAPRGASGALIGVGPLLLLHLLLFQNTARLTAVTGWPLPAALLVILAADAVAVLAAWRVRAAGAAPLAAVVLVPAALLAHGVGPAAAGALVAGVTASGVVLVGLLASGEARRPHRSPDRTVAWWGLSIVLLIVPAFLYYVGYDLLLPFENTLLPPLLALIAALAVLPRARLLATVPRPSGPALIGAAILILVPLALWPGYAPPPARAEAGWPVRVMAYNLHQGYGISGAQDLEALARTIEAALAEVVALQEVSRGWLINGSTEMLAWLSRRLAMSAAWGPAVDAAQGSAILSRRPIVGSGYLMLPRGGMPMRRSAMWAEIDLGGGERLLAINTHFHHVPRDGHVREPQAAALVRLWDRRERAVVLGDLNATPDAREIALLREAGLRDAFEVAGGAGDGFTFRADRLYQRIDYIWVSPDLAARDFRVLPGGASDHLGIAVTVSR